MPGERLMNWVKHLICEVWGLHWTFQKAAVWDECRLCGRSFFRGLD